MVRRPIGSSVTDEPKIALEQIFVGDEDTREVWRFDFLFAFEDEFDVGARRETGGVKRVDSGQQRKYRGLRI
jgi:hypothetical protein